MLSILREYEYCVGYKKEDYVTLLDHIARIGDIALEFSKSFNESEGGAVTTLYGCASNVDKTAEEIRAERRDLL